MHDLLVILGFWAVFLPLDLAWRRYATRIIYGTRKEAS